MDYLFYIEWKKEVEREKKIIEIKCLPLCLNKSQRKKGQVFDKSTREYHLLVGKFCGARQRLAISRLPKQQGNTVRYLQWQSRAQATWNVAGWLQRTSSCVGVV